MEMYKILVVTMGVCITTNYVFANNDEFGLEKASFDTSLSFDDSTNRLSLEEEGGSGWYMIPKIGVNLPGDVNDSGLSFEFQSGLSLGLAVGFELTDTFALQLEAGYMKNDVNRISDSTGFGVTPESLGASVELTQVPILISGVWTNSSKRSRPYFGVGIGAINGKMAERFTINGIAYSVEDDEWALAYQAEAGMRFHWSYSSDLIVGYRFMHAAYSDGADMNNHTIHVGWSFKF